MSPTSPPPAADSSADSDKLSVFDAGNIIIGIVIGTSIFNVPWLIFMSSGGPWASLVVWLLGGALAFIGALCYAELATSFPRSGGDYVYLTKAFGPGAGFLFGWAQLAVVLTASIGAMAIAFGDFATGLFVIADETTIGGFAPNFVFAVGAIVLLTIVNLAGVVLGKLAQNVLTIAKLLGLIAILVAGFSSPVSSPATWPTDGASTFTWGSLAIILVLYAYGGWNDAAFVAAEVRDPRRNIPKALFIGVGIITVVYLLVNFAYLVGLGYDDAKKPGRLPALLVERALERSGREFADIGALASRAMCLIVMLSALGAVNGLTFAGARVYATMGNDHRLFAFLGHWKPGRGAPILALLVQAVVTIAMIATFATKQGHDLVNDLLAKLNAALASYPSLQAAFGIETGEWRAGSGFEKLAAISAPVFWFFFMLTGLSLFVLRRHTTPETRPFSVPLYPILPLVFVATCGYMLYQASMYVKWQCLFTVLLTLAGLPLYGISRMLGYHEGADDE